MNKQRKEGKPIGQERPVSGKVVLVGGKLERKWNE